DSDPQWSRDPMQKQGSHAKTRPPARFRDRSGGFPASFHPRTPPLLLAWDFSGLAETCQPL
ncbi:hypothetical protein NW823_06570, partial [Synechococcus sp. R55.1]